MKKHEKIDPKLLTNPMFFEIAQKAQILCRTSIIAWSICKGYCVIPKSVNEEE